MKVFDDIEHNHNCFWSVYTLQRSISPPTHCLNFLHLEMYPTDETTIAFKVIEDYQV